MKTVDIVTSQNVTIEYKLASILERLLALIIDMAIVFVYIFLMATIFLQAVTFSHDAETIAAVYIIITIPPLFFYNLFFEMFNSGRSIGKLALGIRVVNLSGRNPTPGECFLRWAFRVVEIGLTMGGLAAMYVSSSAKAQRLGDQVARTVVIKSGRNNAHSLKELLRIKSRENYQPVYTQVTRYNDEEMLFVKNCLERVRNYPNPSNRKLVDELTAKICIQLNIHPAPEKKKQAEFLKNLLQDYIVLTRS